MRKFEVWLNPFGEIYLFEWNPCGCHPNDYYLQKGTKFGDTVSISAKSKSGETRWRKNRGWERLGDL